MVLACAGLHNFLRKDYLLFRGIFGWMYIWPISDMGHDIYESNLLSQQQQTEGGGEVALQFQCRIINLVPL